MSATAKPLGSPANSPEQPLIGDLAATLHFDPDQGHIWLAGRRMMMMHTGAYGVLRRELVDVLGLEGARAAFTRQGYSAGASDAEAAVKVRSTQSLYAVFSAGPQMHGLEGIVCAEPLLDDIDIESGRFYSEYRWTHSAECQTHLEVFGVGHAPAGWALVGYASGYASVFLGRPIIYREVECIAMGHPHCRSIGRPAEEWEDAQSDLRYMRSKHLVSTDRARAQPVESRAKAKAVAANRHQIVGASAGFNVAFDMLRHVADTDATVLFLGESGVGKELFARNLHAMGKRADKPFISVNCAAIPDQLVEAELFGVEKGAFTGAVASRPGRFERAEKGTLFLDEIGTLTLAAQAKLLRVLQEGEVERIGGTQLRQVDVRLVAATNANLQESVAQGTFREDLFYRLNLFPITIPPLRERKADIPLMLEHFLAKFSARYDKQVSHFDEEALSAILTYHWPGNVRELENVVERGVILARPGEPLRIHHLFRGGEKLRQKNFALRDDGHLRPSAASTDQAKTASDPIEELLGKGVSIDEVEATMVERALELAGGNRSKAAKLIGLSRAQFNYRLGKRHD